MATEITIKKSNSLNGSVAKSPAALSYGELAMNYKTGYEALFFKNDSGNIITLNNWAQLRNKPTTLAGYGITDAATSGHTHDFSAITGKPTYLSGYGITDAMWMGDSFDYFTLDLARAPMTSNIINLNRRSSIFSGLKALTGAGDYFYCADLNPNYTISSNYNGVDANIGAYNGTSPGIACLFNNNMSTNFFLPTANLATTPWVISILCNNTITATDVLHLSFYQHCLQRYGYVNSYKIEIYAQKADSSWEWYTVSERTGVEDSLNGASLPIYYKTGTQIHASVNYAYIKGVRITISGADSTGSFKTGYLPITAIQLRDYRPSMKPSDALGALDIRGGYMYGDANWYAGRPKVNGVDVATKNEVLLLTGGTLTGGLTGTTIALSSTIAATTAILGNLTSGYIPRHTASGLANSLMYDSGIGIGIGTTSVGSWKYVIQGTYPFQVKDSSANAVFEFYADTKENRYLNGMSIVGWGQDLVIKTSASNYDVILAPAFGNVGIGTTNPTYKLDVTGDARFTSGVTAAAFYGNASSATQLSGTLPVIATATESNVISVIDDGNGAITTNSPNPGMAAIRHGFSFKWYSDDYHFGIIRGGGTESQGLGVTQGASNLLWKVRSSDMSIYVTAYTQALNVQGELTTSKNICLSNTAENALYSNNSQISFIKYDASWVNKAKLTLHDGGINTFGRVYSVGGNLGVYGGGGYKLFLNNDTDITWQIYADGDKMTFDFHKLGSGIQFVSRTSVGDPSVVAILDGFGNAVFAGNLISNKHVIGTWDITEVNGELIFSKDGVAKGKLTTVGFVSMGGVTAMA